MNVLFFSRELHDLLVVWVALGLAFAIFLAGGGNRTIQLLTNESFGLALVVSLLTTGVGLLLHGVAHKVVAVRFSWVAEFHADYGILAVAIMSALVGFIFAAPDAVYHHGVLTEREHGLITLARPMTNLLLLVAFAPVLVVGVLVGPDVIQLVGLRGLIINAFLATFNMLPLGSLDGKTVKAWSTPVFAGVLVLSILLTAGLSLFVGF